MRERKRRYQDYASSSAGQSRTSNPRSQVPRSPSAGPKLARGDEQHQLVIAMSDPFTACSANGYLPRIPDGCVRDTGVFKFLYNVDVYSDANGRAFFFLDTSPFRSYAVSTTNSLVTNSDTTGFKGSAEYDAYEAATGRLSNGVGSMPPWTGSSWSIPVVRVQNDGVTYPTTPVAQSLCGMRPSVGYGQLWDVAQAWRPVCAGIRFKNTGEVLGRKGNVAIARWPGSHGLPTTANPLLLLNGTDSESSTFTSAIGQGPNFETVQALPTKKVVPLCEGFTAVWAPETMEAHSAWRPIHPKPMGTTATISGIEAYSDTINTGVVILPDPCNGDPCEYKALMDRVYTQNPSAFGIDDPPYGAPQSYGDNAGLYFQSFGGTALGNATISSFAMRDLMRGCNETSMLVDNTCLVCCFEGCEASSLLGTIEVAIGVEYLADSSLVTTGNGAPTGRVNMPVSKQIDAHHATLTVMKHVPAVIEGGVSIAESLAGAVPKIAAAASAVAPYLEAAISAIGALL